MRLIGNVYLIIFVVFCCTGGEWHVFKILLEGNIHILKTRAISLYNLFFDIYLFI
jgi:hypothetical protein